MNKDDLIARRPSGRTGLADWYAAVFEAQRAEGQTTAELATLLEVTTANIYYWRRRLQEPSVSACAAHAETPRAGLVEVRLAASTSSSGTLPQARPLELRLAGARTVLVPSGFDPGDLRALVGALEAC